MKKGYVLVLMLMSCALAMADGGYVSPENYAVNEADLYHMYQQNMAQTQVSSARKEKKYREYDENKGLKAKLRKMRYNMQEPHHGQLHEIKLNTPYKLRQAGLLPPEESVEEQKVEAQIPEQKKVKVKQAKPPKIKKEKEKKIKTKKEKIIKPDKLQTKKIEENNVQSQPVYDYSEPDSSLYDNIYNGVGESFNL